MEWPVKRKTAPISFSITEIVCVLGLNFKVDTGVQASFYALIIAKMIHSLGE